MADVYFNGTNVGTLDSSMVKKLKDEKIMLKARGGKAIVVTEK